MRSQKYKLFWRDLPEVIAERKWDDGRPNFKLEVPFDFTINGKKFSIPAGFEFDFASIPRPFWSIFLPNDPRWQSASLIHDWLYAAEWCPRRQADDIFLCAMAEGRTPAVSRALMWWAVRAFGWSTYGEHTYIRIKAIRALSQCYDMTRPLYDDVMKMGA